MDPTFKEKSLREAADLAAKEVKILEDPTSSLYPIIRRKLQSMFPINTQIQSKLQKDYPIEDSAAVEAPFTKKHEIRAPTRAKSPLTVLSSPLAKQTRTVESPVRKPFKASPVPSTVLKASKKLDFTPSPIFKLSKQSPKSTSKKPELKPIPITKTKIEKENEAPVEFFIPSISLPKGTKSGLRPKEKQTEFELMRLESDQRLRKAVQHAVRKQKELEDLKAKKKNLASQKLLNRKPLYSRNTENMSNVDVKEEPKKIKSPVRTKGDEKLKTPTTNKVAMLKSKSLDSLPSKSTQKSTPKATPKLTKAKLNPLPSSQPIQRENEKEVFNGILEVLSSKLDPVLISMQEQWAQTAKKIEEKLNQPILHPEQPIPVKAEPIGSCNEMEKEIESDADYQLKPPFYEIISIPAANCQPIIPECDRSALESIENIGVDASLIEITVSHKSGAEEEFSKLDKRLVLPRQVIDSVRDDQYRRIKWFSAYFGYSEYQQPYTAIEMIAHEMLNDAIEKITCEIDGISNEFIEDLVQDEFSFNSKF